MPSITPAAARARPLPPSTITDANRIVQKLWSDCPVLRDDGLSCGDHLEQLSLLLFFKLARDKSNQICSG
jgi:type I restriction enzyme M protein